MEKILLKLDKLAETISSEVKNKIFELNSIIKVVSIILGEDTSSLSYLKGMQKKAIKAGCEIEILQLPVNIPENELLDIIKKYNLNNEYSGIIIQVPLPKHIDFFKLSNIIDFRKDIDGISPINQGRLFFGNPFLIPATAQAVDLTLSFIEKNYSFPLSGKNAVIIGRSLTVGKPVFHLLLKRNITPTIVHTKTQETEKITRNADIIVATCGIPELINESWIKENAVVIDVGIHCIECESINSDSINNNVRICGDVESFSVLKKASIVTAVPGGIGIVTSSLIFANALKSWFKINKNEEIIFNFER